MRIFKISVRAGFSFILITCLLIVLGGISLWKMQDIRKGMIDLQDNSMASIIAANKIGDVVLRLRLDVPRLIAQTDPQAKILLLSVSSRQEEICSSGVWLTHL